MDKIRKKDYLNDLQIWRVLCSQRQYYPTLYTEPLSSRCLVTYRRVYFHFRGMMSSEVIQHELDFISNPDQFCLIFGKIMIFFRFYLWQCKLKPLRLKKKSRWYFLQIQCIVVFQLPCDGISVNFRDLPLPSWKARLDSGGSPFCTHSNPLVKKMQNLLCSNVIWRGCPR